MGENTDNALRTDSERSRLSALACWCGSSGLTSSPNRGYIICNVCGTAQLTRLAELRAGGHALDFAELYSADYWDSHQRDMGLPGIRERARLDLPERCLYWLDYVLQYRLPPARSLEVGCAHGAFVKLMASAGFEAVGIEMNPATIKNARDWFGVTVVQGPLERVTEDIGLFDLVLLFDVMEHLTDPVTSLTRITKHLKPDGILVFQTPQYHQERPAAWRHFNAPEHTFLFSERSVRLLLKRTGLPFVEFHPPMFPDDMFAFASATPMPRNSKQAISESLEMRPDGRLILGMFELLARAQKSERLAAMNPFNRHGPGLMGRFGLSFCKQFFLRLFRSSSPEQP